MGRKKGKGSSPPTFFCGQMGTRRERFMKGEVFAIHQPLNLALDVRHSLPILLLLLGELLAP